MKNKIFVKNKKSEKIYEFVIIQGIFEDFIQLIEIKNKIDYIEFYCGRPSIYGNPYSNKNNTLATYKTSSIEESIQLYKNNYLPSIKKEIDKIKIVYENNNICLTCFCVPQKCHVFEIAKNLWKF
jgi:hypothetical protein